MPDTPSNDARLELCDLAERYMQHDLDGAGLARLNTLLKSDPALRAEFVALCTDAQVLSHALAQHGHESSFGARLAKLTRTESAAPARPVPVGRSLRLPVAIALAAALLLSAAAVAVYLLVIPSEIPTPGVRETPVATLIDATDAILFEDDIATQGEVYGRGVYAMESGAATLQLTSGASVEMHGNTRLHIGGAMVSTLMRGSATFHCPRSAAGYTVRLPDGSSVVDLGTRFTITIEDDGVARVELIEGQVVVNVPTRDAVAKRYPLTEPGVVRVAGSRVESWRMLSLADVVAGGDGTGDRSGAGIRLADGSATAEHRANSEPGVAANVFVPAVHPLVDGVFVPDGGDGNAAVPISSTGLTATGLADTDGRSWDELWGGHNVGVTTPLADAFVSVIGMHANKGVTFDLDAFRTANAGWSTRSVDLSAAVGHNTTGGSIVVLVDGRERARADLGTPNSNHAIEIDLSDADRFLTILALQGKQSGDWLFIGDPSLRLTRTIDPPAEPNPGPTHEEDEPLDAQGKETR